MAESIKPKEIQITRIINPSKFFYFSLNDQKLKVVKENEEELQKFFTDQSLDEKYQPKIGDVCAFFHNSSQKWIRVAIDDIKASELAILWCIDYGVSLSTNNFNQLAAISGNLKTDHHFIHTGCLKVLPTKSDFDLVKGETVIESSLQWTPKAVEVAKNFVKFAREVRFISKERRGNVHFGDIEGKDEEGEKFSLCQMLLDRRLAFFPEDELFYEGVKNLDSITIERWNDNERTGGVLLKAEETNFMLELPKSRCPDPGSGSDETPVCNFEKICAMLESVKVTKSAEPNVHRTDSNKENKADNVAEPSKVPDQAAVSQKPAVQSVLRKVIEEQNPAVSLMDVANIFIHGNLVTNPVENIRDAIFYKEIHDGLRAMNFRTVFRTQAYCWPNIAEGRNVFLVNNAKSGKTFSYLPAILTSVVSWEEGQTPSAQGPIGIIIVRSSREVEILYKYCLKLLPREKLAIIKAFGKWNCHNKKVDLFNGCDLLITTPPCFSRLAEGESIRMFSRNRIKHLVFDGLDSMHEIFEKEIKDIIKTCTWGEKHVDTNPQLVITSTRADNIRSYMRLSPDPIVIIGSFVEAAVYSKCRFTIIKNSHEEKLDRLAVYLKRNRWQMKKTLVVLNSQLELEHVAEFLRKNDLAFSYIDNKAMPSDVIESCKCWVREKPGKMTIMLAIDEVLPECKWKCVDVLIHFSLPSTWSRFSRRFSTMNEAFLDFVTGKTSRNPYTIVMLDDRNAKEIPRLIAFAEDRKLLEVIPEDIKILVKCIIDEREALKRESGEEISLICSNIYQFGKCGNFYSCNKRHVFIESDKPVNIPVDGLLKFELVGVQKPSHYVIKILEHLPAGAKKWISCEQKIQRIEKSLEELQQMMKEVCVIQAGAMINDLCAVFCPKKVEWCRCKVLEKQNIDTPAKFKAIVHCIDSGRKMIVQSTDLMVLPESIKLLDPLVTDLRILNLVPFDKDENWDHETTAELTKFFSRKKNLGDYMLANVEFSVQNTIFTETFEIRYRFDELDVDVTKYSLLLDLLKKNFCLKDEAVLHDLKDLMKRANLYVPEKAEVEVKTAQPIKLKSVEAQSRWKNLTVGSEYQVYVKHFESPNLFYVCLDDSSNNVLRKLIKQVESCEERIPLKELKDGEFCLVVLKDEKPKRGLITDAKKNESVEIFLLDAGELIVCDKNEIYELPAAAINAAPFQAVQCRLMGVKPRFKLTDWPARGLRVLRGFVSNFCGTNLQNMRVVGRNQNTFDVALIDQRSRKKLHNVLVQESLADPNVFEDTDSTVGDDKSSEKTAEELEIKLENHAEALWKLLNDPEAVVDLIPSVPPPVVPAAEKNLSKNPKKKVKLPEQKLLPQPTSSQAALSSTLRYIHKHPKIEWRQNEISIWLSISATDCSDYALKVSDSSLKVFIKYRSEQYEYTSLQLFGVVMADFVSHEKIGEKITVRLLKRLALPWSRLTDCNEPNRFITFNHDEVPKWVGGSNGLKISGQPAGCEDWDEDDSKSVMSEENDVVKDFNEPF